MRQFEDARNRSPMLIVIAAHRCDWLFNSRRASVPNRWKEDELLLLHVNFKFPDHAMKQISQSGGDVRRIRMNSLHLGGKRCKPGQIFAMPRVIVLLDEASEQFLIKQSVDRMAYRQRLVAASVAPVT